MNKKTLHLFSGGMDSTVLLYDLLELGHSVHCVLFDYQQRHVKELTFAKQHCQIKKVPYTVITLPQLKGSELTDGSGGVVVPNRNAILLNVAVNLAVGLQADLVTFGANADDESVFPDCRKLFVDTLNASVKAAGYNIKILAPYLDWPKWKIGAKAQDMKIPISETWSCYRGGEKPCGECLACITREAALK